MPGEAWPWMKTWSPPPGWDFAAEEVVEADLVERGRRGVGRNVAAHTDSRTLSAVHHDGGVPPDPGPVATLDLLVAGEPRLQLGRDGVDVVGRRQRRDGHPLFAGAFQQPQHQVARPRRALSVPATGRRTPATRRSPRDRYRAGRTQRLRGSPVPGRVRLRCRSFGPDPGARTRWSTSTPRSGGLRLLGSATTSIVHPSCPTCTAAWWPSWNEPPIGPFRNR